MPNVHVPVPETQQNIFRPIVTEIVRQVQIITKMPETRIYFPDEDNKVQTNGSTIDETSNERFVSTTSKRMNRIQVEEEVDNVEISPTFFNSREYSPIFQDKDLDITLTPVYAKHNVTITFNYSSDSKTEALRWLADMRMKISKLRDINNHTVQYHYNIDQRFYDLIKLMYDLREKQGGYNETFNQYIKRHANPRLTNVSNSSGLHQILAVAERQTEIIGIYDFEGLPSKPEKDEAGTWVIAFGYQFNYDKVIGTNLKYPIAVHNQPLPLNYVSFNKQEVRPVYQGPIDYSRTQSAFALFRSDLEIDRIKQEDGIIIIPNFDDFKPSIVLARTAGVLQVQTIIEPNNLRDLVSLKELGDVVLDDDVLDFLSQSEYQYLTKPYQSIFHVELFQNKYLQSYPILSVDSNLNIRATEDLDIRKQYRIRLSVVADIDFLSNEAIARLRLYPKVLYKVIASINKAYRENPELVKLGLLRQLTPLDFDALYRTILSKERSYLAPQIGLGVNGLLNKYGISNKTLNDIKIHNRSIKNTMILGILAYNKKDQALADKAEAGYLDIPLVTENNF